MRSSIHQRFTIRLLINSRDLRTLREQYLENTYFPADFYWRDVHVRNLGVIGYAGMNNIYLHRHPSSSRHEFIPWDRDNAFQDIESSVFQRFHENLLLERALGFADLQALYLDTLERSAFIAAQERLAGARDPGRSLADFGAGN